MDIGNLTVDPEVNVDEEVTTNRPVEGLENYIEGYLYQYLKENYLDLWREIDTVLVDFAETQFVHQINGPFSMSTDETLRYVDNSFGNFDPRLYEDGFISEDKYEEIESAVSEALEAAVDSFNSQRHPILETTSNSDES
jgi:hypothetical protein